MTCARRTTVEQCKTCPWRIGIDPEADIPNYRRSLHEGLADTIQGGAQSLHGALVNDLQIMACYYSKADDEFPCAGWLHHQLNEGNNLGVRYAVAMMKLPAPVVDGPQHTRFEDTLPKPKRRRRRGKR